MKKGIILLALLFTACVNLENIGGNSGGDIKIMKEKMESYMWIMFLLMENKNIKRRMVL